VDKKDEFICLLNKFIADRIESEDGGYASVSREDLSMLSDLVYRIIELKWGRDCDSDLPVGYQLIDRSKERFLYPSTILHGAGEETLEKLLGMINSISEEARRIVVQSRYLKEDKDESSS
jgi:hypothetical protein